MTGPPPAAAGPAGTARILYIDDDPGLARLVQRALGARGYV
ncbi:two-component system sensor histidine kinase/response regulator, partial [Methylobacterium sp. WL122]